MVDGLAERAVGMSARPRRGEEPRLHSLEFIGTLYLICNLWLQLCERLQETKGLNSGKFEKREKALQKSFISL